MSFSLPKKTALLLFFCFSFITLLLPNNALAISSAHDALVVDAEVDSYGDPIVLGVLNKAPDVSGQVVVKFPGNNTRSFLFGTGTLSDPANYSVKTMAVDSNGRVAVLFGAGRMIMMLDRNGYIDTSFGNNGFAKPNISQWLSIRDIKFKSNGKILLLGGYSDRAAVAQLNTDGTLDTGFGSSGVFTQYYYDSEFFNLELDSSGNIYASGWTASNNKLGVVKLTAAGALDTTFGSGGKAASAFSGALETTKIINGNIYLAGNTNDSSAPNGFDGLIVKFTSSGTVDTSFGSSGAFQHDSSYSSFASNKHDYIKDIYVDAFGGIEVLGSGTYPATCTSSVNYIKTAVKYSVTASGALDLIKGETPSFGDLNAAGTCYTGASHSKFSLTTLGLQSFGSRDTRILPFSINYSRWNPYDDFTYVEPLTVWVSGSSTSTLDVSIEDPDERASRGSGGKNGNPDTVGDPVNIVSGNVNDSATDLLLPGPSFALEFSRSYNSNSLKDRTAASQPLGRGWTHNFNTFLLADNSANKITVFDADGSVLTFFSDGTTWKSVTSKDKLIKTFSDSKLTRTNGEVWEFNSSGNLTKIKDLVGNQLTFAYSSGKLSTITNSAGRSITLTYTGNVITKAADSAGREVNYSYTSGNLTSVTDVNSKTTSYAYDSLNRLISRTKPGTTSNPSVPFEFAYDSKGRADTAGYANGNQELEFSYDPQNFKTTIKDVNGNDTVYRYNSKKQIIKITDPKGKSFEYGWTGTNKTSAKDKLGNTSNMTYDARGNLLTVQMPKAKSTDPAGPLTTYVYGAYDQVTSITTPGGATAAMTYDSQGKLTKAVDDDGNEIRYSNFDAFGQPQTKTFDPISSGAPNRVVTYVYASNGDLLETQEPENKTTKFVYNSLGQIIQSKEAIGTTSSHRTTDFEYWPSGLLKKTTYPKADSSSTRTFVTYDYDERGNLVKTTDERGKQTEFSYDGLDQLVETVDATGRTTESEYDDTGAVIKTTLPGGIETDYEFDELNQLVKLTQQDGSASGFVIEKEYNDAGKLVKLITPKEAGETSDRETEFEYDNLGRLVKTIDAKGGETTQSYDIDGNVLTLTDPNYVSSSPTDHKTTYTYSDMGQLLSKTVSGRTWTYSYDDFGNQATQLDPNGVLTDYDYDKLDRLVSKNYSDSTPTITFAYDSWGDMTGVADASGTSSFVYDDLHRMLSKTAPSGIQAYEYDETSNVTNYTLPGETNPVEYEYDDAGRIVKVKAPGVANGTDYVYNAAGLLESKSFSGGTAGQFFDYDAGGRLTDIQNKNAASSVVASLEYEYSPAGNIAEITDENADTSTFSFDQLDRIVSESHSKTGDNMSYTYDASGNRLTSMKNSVSSSYVYNARNELLSVTTGSSIRSFGYDNNGQMILDNDGVSSTAYAYDADGNTVSAGSQTNTYNAFGERVLTTDGLASTSYAFDNGDIVQSTTGIDKSNFIRGPDLAARQTSTGIEYYTQDAVGSVMGIHDAVGSQTDHYAYSAFGEVLSRTGTSANPFGYLGNQQNLNTSTMDFNARSYDPGLGRFISRDPISGSAASTQTWNPYGHGGNNPLSNPDPSGLVYLDLVTGNGPDFSAYTEYNATASSITDALPVISKFKTLAMDKICGRETDWLKLEAGLATDMVGLGVAKAAGKVSFSFAKKFPSLSPHLLRLMKGTEGSVGGGGSRPMSGPVVFILKKKYATDPKNVKDIDDYTKGCENVRQCGLMSKGRISTSNKQLQKQIKAAVRKEKNRKKYNGVAGHVPDTAWGGHPTPPGGWIDMNSGLNSSLGGQIRGYPVGYQPTSFRWEYEK